MAAPETPLDNIRSLTGAVLRNLVGHRLTIGDITVEIDTLAMTPPTAAPWEHWERMTKHAETAARTGPFDPFALLHTGIDAFADTVRSGFAGAAAAEQGWREASQGRFALGRELVGTSSQVQTPHVILSSVRATSTNLWARPLASTTQIDVELDPVEVSAHIDASSVIEAITPHLADNLTVKLEPLELEALERAPDGELPAHLVVRHRRLPRRVSAPVQLAAEGPRITATVGTLDVDFGSTRSRSIGSRSVGLRSRSIEHVFEPLGPNATIRSIACTTSGLVVEATIATMRWTLDVQRVASLVAAASRSARELRW